MRRTLSSIVLVGALLAALAPAPTRAASIDPAAIRVDPDGAHAGESTLTLDAELQQAAERLLSHAHPLRGAIVAADVATGRILAYSDTPKGELLPGKRAPAASLFKIVTTAALLELGKVSPKRVVCTDGGLRGIERRHLEAPRRGKAHCAPFRTALGHSRNAAYAQLVTRFLMRSDLIRMGERFGFGRELAFDGGQVLMGTLDVPFNDLEFARAAAGFRGSTLSVPGALQLALVVARGGRSVPLTLIEGSTPADKPLRVLHPATAAELRRMMEVTVHSGTSLEAFTDEDGRARLPGLRVAGKTGTLQPSPGDPTTSWFIGFAPSRKPKIAIAVLLQNGRVWRQKANEVGRDFLAERFSRP